METSNNVSNNEITEEVEIKEYKEKEINLDLKNSEIIKVILEGENTTINSDSIQTSGQIITIKKSGNYEFSGVLTDGQIIVDTDDEKNVQIILNNVEITNNSGPTIFIKNTSQAIINLADNSKNTLIDGKSYSESEEGENANIYSKEDLIINGNGELNVTGNYNDGITSKDRLFIESAKVNVVSKDDGIRGKDYLLIESGNINIRSEGDALKSDNEDKATILINGGNIELSAGDDAIHSEVYLTFNGGNINVLESYEGLEAKFITFNGGDISIVSSDDGINASSGSSEEEGISSMFKGKGGGESDDGSVVYFNGGEVVLNANGDGFDSNGKIIMTGGKITVFGPELNNNGSIDYNGTFEIIGGELIAIGSNGMVQTPSESEEVNTISIGLTNSYSSGKKVSLENNSGEKILDIESIKEFQSIVFSSNKLVTGETYYYYIDGEKIGDITINNPITTIGEVSTGKRGR